MDEHTTIVPERGLLAFARHQCRHQNAHVVFVYPDGFLLPDDHELADITLPALADRLESGELQLTQNPDIEYTASGK